MVTGSRRAFWRVSQRSTWSHAHCGQSRCRQELYHTRAVPGVGTILALVLLYEIHDIHRCPRVQDFVSSARLVTCAQESAGQRYGTAGPNRGHAYLKWAFSEAAVLCLRHHSAGQQCLAKLERKHGQGKALTSLAHQLGRAVYDRRKRQTVFALEPFLPSEREQSG
jgi:transposase